MPCLTQSSASLQPSLLPAAIINPFEYEGKRGRLQPVSPGNPSHRVAALYHVLAALFWAGLAEGHGPVKYKRVAPNWRDGVVGKPGTQQIHRIAALWQFMVLNGVELNATLRSR